MLWRTSQTSKVVWDPVRGINIFTNVLLKPSNLQCWGNLCSRTGMQLIKVNAEWQKSLVSQILNALVEHRQGNLPLIGIGQRLQRSLKMLCYKCQFCRSFRDRLKWVFWLHSKIYICFYIMQYPRTASCLLLDWYCSFYNFQCNPFPIKKDRIAC